MFPLFSECFVKRTANFHTKENILKVFSLQSLQGLNDDKVFTFFQVNAVIFCAEAAGKEALPIPFLGFPPTIAQCVQRIVYLMG